MTHMKRSWRLLVLALAAGAAAAHCTPRGDSPTRVVLITLDTLRLDSFLGTEDRPEQMPRLRRWAERGRIFGRGVLRRGGNFQYPRRQTDLG